MHGFWKQNCYVFVVFIPFLVDMYHHTVCGVVQIFNNTTEHSQSCRAPSCKRQVWAAAAGQAVAGEQSGTHSLDAVDQTACVDTQVRPTCQANLCKSPCRRES